MAYSASNILGHWPKPMSDDPKGIEGFVFGLTYAFASALIFPGVFAYLIVMLGVGCLATQLPQRFRFRVWLEIGAGLVLLLLGIFYLSWDPHSLWVWYID